MVIDSSALIAIFLNEPERRRFNELIEADSVKLISAATFLETAIVMERRAAEAWQLDAFIQSAAIQVISVTYEHAEVARAAFRNYGRGRHPARLNFGYALSKITGEALLCKGADFGLTDLPRVVARS